MKLSILVVGAVGLILLPLIVLFLVFVAVSDDDEPTDFAQGSLATGTVPPEFEAWVIKAGSICAEVSAPLVAAQIEQESGWNPDAVSPAGAQGFSQFMPYTWPSYGVDANRNGVISPFDPPDAIMAQGKFDCEIAAQAKRDIASGRIQGDLVDIILNAYNCGYGCVLANGGPNIVNGETEGYAPGVKARMAKYTQLGTAGTTGPQFRPGGPFGQNVIAAALKWQGAPYAWGGGNADGPTKGISDGGGAADAHGDFTKLGFDCSGLTLYAVAQASGRQIILPHYTGDTSNPGQLYDQRAQEVPFDQKQPGDLIFFGAGGNTHHVGIYYGRDSSGADQLLNAPQSGQTVSIQPLSGWAGEQMYVRRFG
ncbi:transglycosylase SLT domain-containing protein [Rhodococcus zopfii]|uniref:Transglycosylase SLT domain-containing protein n=1 Tax=Rhodococcus zopfii TaxID=43772 RepID=A0ABU3WTN3_9NOCA|nr:transglycosylase SLT domain-containing protein [Rhodococcus zopfii]